jgi:hypothetical protein
MRFERMGGTWRPLARIVLVGVGCAAGFVLVYYVTVRTVQGRLFGDASLRGALLTRSALADSTTTILNVVSVASLLGAMALVATVALVRLDRVHGLAAVGIVVGANLSALLLKSYLLDRPDFGLLEVSPATLNSLPSGHVTAVSSAGAALLFVVPTRLRYPAGVGGLVAVAATALATMSAGWHRAGDSMAAFLLVGVWVSIAGAAVLIADHGGPIRPAFEWPASARRLVALSAGALTLGLAVGAALDVAGSIRDATLGAWIAFGVGGLLITGTGIAVLLGILDVLAATDTPRPLPSAAHQPPRGLGGQSSPPRKV